MDLVSLSHNIKTSWRFHDCFFDFFKRLLWIYSNKLPGLRNLQWEIGFNYSEPIGRVRFVLRSNGGSDSFIHGEVFEHRYYDIGLSVAPETILDLGANIGLTGVYFARCFSRAVIACVEPMPSNVAVLRKNLELNGVPATVFAGAISDRDGRLFMDVDKHDYGHRVAVSAKLPAATCIAVSAYSIPTLLRQLRWERIGLLKVDIEGHEKVLLSGAASWAHLVDAMCIEWHDGLARENLSGFAQRFGFRQPEQLPGIWLLRR